MKLTVTTDDGIVLEVIEDVQEWDLAKSMARADLLWRIEEAIRQGLAEVEEE